MIILYEYKYTSQGVSWGGGWAKELFSSGIRGRVMVSVKLGSMDPDVLHYMEILNRYKGLSDGKCKIRVDGPRCFTLHANFD